MYPWVPRRIQAIQITRQGSWRGKPSFLHNYLIFLNHSYQITTWGNLNPPTIPKELSDEENYPVCLSPGLPRPTFPLSLLHFNSHLSIAALFNRKQHCETLTYSYFLEFPGKFLFWQLSYVIVVWNYIVTFDCALSKFGPSIICQNGASIKTRWRGMMIFPKFSLL